MQDLFSSLNFKLVVFEFSKFKSFKFEIFTINFDFYSSTTSLS